MAREEIYMFRVKTMIFLDFAMLFFFYYHDVKLFCLLSVHVSKFCNVEQAWTNVSLLFNSIFLTFVWPVISIRSKSFKFT